MIQSHKRGLFELIKDTTIYYRTNTNCTGCNVVYEKEDGFVKDGVIYTKRMLFNPYRLTIPLRFEEDFSNLTKEDYEVLGVDFIAVYECPHLDYNSNCSIVSYRRYDGVYFPTAKYFMSLYILQ